MTSPISVLMPVIVGYVRSAIPVQFPPNTPKRFLCCEWKNCYAAALWRNLSDSVKIPLQCTTACNLFFVQVSKLQVPSLLNFVTYDIDCCCSFVEFSNLGDKISVVGTIGCGYCDYYRGEDPSGTSSFIYIAK